MMPRRFLLVLAAALAAACAVLPAARAAHVLDRALAREHKATGTTLGEVLTHILATDDVSEWKNHGGIKALKAMYASASENKAELKVTAGSGVEHTVDDTQVAWLKHLRTAFPSESASKLHPKVHIRGAGPTGLGAALQARANKAAHVHVQNDYNRYYRQHTVSTTTAKPIGDTVPNGGVGVVTPDGAENLVHGLLGINKDPTADSIAVEWYKAIKWHKLGTGRFIMVSDLEKMLALTAHVVGVHFSFDKKQAADTGSRDTRRTEGRDSALKSFPLAACAAYSPGKSAAHDSADDYDILVGAEGPGSPTRNHYLTGVKMTVPKCHTNAHKFKKDGVDYAVSTELAAAGLVSIGFVVDASTVAGAAFCAKSRSGSYPKSGIVRGYYLKDFKEHKVCQLEATLTKEGGQLLRKAFTSRTDKHTCSFNFNRFGGTKAQSTELTKELELLKYFLGAGIKAGSPASPTVEDVMDNVLEFKFWENNLRMATANDNLEYTAVRAYVGKVHEVERTHYHKQYSGKRTEKQMVVILGDAVRDALPDSGMGVNDGAHQAKEFGALVASYAAATRPSDMDAFNIYLTKMSKHEAQVVCGLHENVLKNYESRAAATQLLKGDIKLAAGKKKLTLTADNAAAAAATSITATIA